MDSATQCRRDEPFAALVKGVLARYISVVVSVLCSVFLTPLLLIHLGSEVYGLYALLGTVMAYLFVLDLGTSNTVPKYVAEAWVQDDAEGLQRLVSSFFFAFLGMGCFLLLLAGVCMPYVQLVFKMSPTLVHTAAIVFFITVANFAVVLPFSALNGLLYGVQKVHLNYWLDTLLSVLNLLFVFIVLKLGYGLIAVAIASLGARFVVSLILIGVARRRCPKIKLRLASVDWKLLKQLASASFYYFLIAIAGLSIFNIDNLVIGAFLGISLVTAYSIASRLTRLPTGLIFSLATVLFPHISELDATRDLARLRTLHIQLTKYSLLMALGICLCLATFGEKVIDLWVGPQNFTGMGVLLSFCLLVPLNALIHCNVEILQGMARHKQFSFVYLIESLLNLALSIALLHYFGVLGVVLGTVVARASTSFWFAPWYTCRVLEQDFGRYIRGVIPVFLPLLPAGVVVLFFTRLPGPPIVPVLGGSLAICVTFLLFAYKLSLNRDEREFLRSRITSLVSRSSVAASREVSLVPLQADLKRLPAKGAQ
jgi:O-antigen/teichoic acid export membrane protein